MNKQIVTRILMALAALVALSPSAMALNVTGYMYTACGGPFSEVAIGINQSGNLQGYGLATSWAATPVGWYGISTYPVGDPVNNYYTYNMAINEKDDWGRMFAFGLLVSKSGGLAKNIKYDYNNAVTGTSWDGNLRNEWCQSFAATGTSIISAGMHQAIEFGPEVYASVHDGGPDGPQIGPTRSFPTVIANASAAYWSAGEVPTIPGHIYCIKYKATNGHRPFFSVAKVQNSDAFPEGRTWRDGVEVDTPLKCVIGQDDDGLVTTMSTKKKDLGFVSTPCAGMSFLANGTSFISVSCLVGSTGGRLVASVHDGVGSYGEGGPQIGPAKYIQTIDWNNRSIAVWGPGEVPLTPGHTYYVKLKRPDGQNFTIYADRVKEYMNGTSYNAGTALSVDYSTTVVLEAFPGSATMQKIGVSGINIARGIDTATITWSTTGTTTDAYVEYGVTTPYTNTAAANNGFTHSVTLTGLSSNTLYHARIVCKGNGYRDNTTRDFVFTTNPAAPNLIANPGFESGNYGAWTMFSTSGDINVRNFPAGGSNIWFGDSKAHTGNWFFGGAANGVQCKGGAYQRLAVTPGKTVSVRGWLWTWQMDQLGAPISYTACGQIGIDPTGGTSPTSASIIWSPYVVAQDLFTKDTSFNKVPPGSWTEVTASAMPTASNVTVFLRAGAEVGMAWTVFGWDDIVATQEPTIQYLNKLSEINAIENGAFVSIPDLMVTSSAAQTGAAYVESSDRSMGIRVESANTFVVGHKVSVMGYLGVKASGERYLYTATISSDAAGTALGSLAATAKQIGNVGPGNVGMLMTAVGEVKSVGTGYVYINDSSMPGDGLKVVTSSLTSVPTVGQFVSFRGIVQLESATVPVLYARSDADMKIN